MGKRVSGIDGMRSVNRSDFSKRNWTSAIYGGRSSYLERGRSYNIQFMSARNKVSVPKCLNPEINCNFGVEFSVGSFFVPLKENES